MSVLTTGAFWASSAERAIKTAAQTALGILTMAASTPADIDWKEAALGTGVATILSLLSSLASIPVGNAGPSLAKEVLTPPAPAVPADQPGV